MLDSLVIYRKISDIRTHKFLSLGLEKRLLLKRVKKYSDIYFFDITEILLKVALNTRTIQYCISAY
jgi:hypothetical protein